VTGPVQVLVVGFDHPSFSGEVLAELARLREAGVVRLVDVLLVSRGNDGTFETLPPPAGADPGLGRIAADLLGADGETGGSDPVDEASWSLADAVEPGGSAAVALIEHLWAGPLVAAVRGAGGQTLAEGWLSEDDRSRLPTSEAP
jgi:uncharacterized membrane protein